MDLQVCRCCIETHLASFYASRVAYSAILAVKRKNIKKVGDKFIRFPASNDVGLSAGSVS
jgi:hypothetical protein